MSKVMSIGDVFIRGEIWLWGERLLYEDGEILLKKRGKSGYIVGFPRGKGYYIASFPGERLLYSQFSGGKSG